MILKVYSAFKGDFSSLLFKKEDASNRERERELIVTTVFSGLCCVWVGIHQVRLLVFDIIIPTLSSTFKGGFFFIRHD